MKRFMVSIACLFAYLLACPSKAQARPKPVVVRLGIAIDASSLQAAAIQQQVLPQAGAQINLVSHRRYLAMADKLALLWPYTPKSARRVGRALHLTHVALFEAAPSDTANSADILLQLRLVDVRTGRVPVHRRFVLPGGHMPLDTAEHIIEALRYMLLGERPRSRPIDAAGNSSATPPGRSKIRAGSAGGIGSSGAAADEAAPTHDASGADFLTLRPAAQAISRASKSLSGRRADRRQMRLGLVMTLRQAHLSPQGGPCYCSGGGFAPAIFGLRAAADLFFDPNKTHFGARFEGAVARATLPLDDSGAADVSQSFPWSIRGDAAYRLFDATPAALIPHVGLSHARFPISRGPFVGTAYTTVYTGAALETQPLARVWILRASGQFSVVVHSGLEAARLGRFEQGLGWQVQAGSAARLGPLRLGFDIGYGALTTHYAQSTALFSTSRYTNVRLDDAALDVQVHLGGSL